MKTNNVFELLSDSIDKTIENVKNAGFCLKEIYGLKTYHKHIEIGEQYRYKFDNDSPEALLAGKTYITITITGVRSGVGFYTIEGHSEKEFWFALKSPMGAYLEPVNPDTDLIIELIKAKQNINSLLNGKQKEIDYNYII